MNKGITGHSKSNKQSDISSIQLSEMTLVPDSIDQIAKIAFTIDVEDWYQSCIDFDAPITVQVVINTERVMAVLDHYNTKATFFIQGLVAETFPNLIRSILAEGHELQSHGYSHRPLHKMDRKALQTELERSRKTIEDAAGVRVSAFRAQDFTIGLDNLWALEVLAETGFKVDSSIFPFKTHRYGISGWPLTPQRIQLQNGAEILEVPVAIWSFGGIRIPVAGGGYFRLIPGVVLEKSLRSILSKQPAVIYCHPYEFNTQELDYFNEQINRVTIFSQGIGRKSFVGKINYLLRQLPFGRFDQVLETWGIL